MLSGKKKKFLYNCIGVRNFSYTFLLIKRKEKLPAWIHFMPKGKITQSTYENIYKNICRPDRFYSWLDIYANHTFALLTRFYLWNFKKRSNYSNKELKINQICLEIFVR